MNKRASHVGMILSFVVFVTFLVFLYSILGPSATEQKNKDIILENLKLNLINSFSEELITVTIGTGNSEHECLSYDQSEAEIEDIDEYYFIAKDSKGEVVAKGSANTNYLEIPTQDNFLKIYYFKSDLLNEGLDSGGDCAEAELKTIKKKNYIFEKKVKEIAGEYGEDYPALKERLEIPVDTEFDFVFVLAEDSGEEDIVAEKEVPNSIGVFAEEIPVQYIDENAEIKSGFINIKVW